MARTSFSTDADGGARFSASRRRGKGRTRHERVALVEAYAKVSFDSSVGDRQKEDLFMARIQEEFLAHSRCPVREVWDGYPDADISSWFWRNERSCKSHVDTIRSECSSLGGAHKRVGQMELTGSVTEDGVSSGLCLSWRCNHARNAS